MNKSPLLFSVFFFFLAIVLTGCTTSPAPAPTSTPAPAASSSSEPEKTNVLTPISLAEVEKHSTGADCWTVINGEVYNLSSFVDKHPGGPVIKNICGKDGTTLFSNQHGQKQLNLAQQLKIGALSNE